MKCEKCGNDIAEGQVVCLICGAEVPKKKKKPEEKTDENGKNETTSDQKPKRVHVKKDHTSLIIVLCFFLTIILVAILSCLFYYKVFVTPKTIFMNSIDTLYDEATLPISELRKNGKYNIKYSTNKSVNSNDEIMNLLSKVAFFTDMTMDYTNSEFAGDVSFQYDNNSVFSSNIYGKKKNVYVLDNKISNYVKMKNKYSDYFSSDSKNISAYITVIKELKNALRVALKESYFKSYQELTTVNGIDMEVTKNEIIINNDNIKTIEHDLVKYLSKSKKYISSMAKLQSKKEQKVKKKLDKTLEGLKQKKTTVKIDTMTFDIYTKGFKNGFVKFSLKQGSDLKEVLVFTKNEQSEYIIKLNINNKYLDVNVKKTQLPEKTSYLINLTNGLDSTQISIEYSFRHDKKEIDSNIDNTIDYETVDKSFKDKLVQDLINQNGKDSFNSDKQKVINWFKETIELFNPTVNVVYDEEESNVEQTNNNDSDSENNYTNPSNQGSINGLGDETINQ